MENEVVIGQVYKDSDGFYRTPIIIKNGKVVYWIACNKEEIGAEESSGYRSVSNFLQHNKPYTPPVTFQRIKDECIKVLLSEQGEAREVIGFSSNGKLITFNEKYDLVGSWLESAIKNWKVAK